MVRYLRVVDGQQSLKLVHLYLQYLELVREQLLKPLLHEVFEQSIAVLLIFALNEQITRNVVHALTVADLLVRVGIQLQDLGENLRFQVVRMHV